MVQRVMGSGKVESAGIFPGKRGGYFVLNVDSAEELMEMVGDAHEVFDVTWGKTPAGPKRPLPVGSACDINQGT